MVRFRSGRASWAAIALLVGLAGFGAACSAFDCGAAYKAFWQEFRELAAHLPGDRIAALTPAAGSVKIQAVTTLLATFQRTADTLRAAPTPTMAPVIV